jgi:CxxC motif-containing protein (DUF1111 family)
VQQAATAGAVRGATLFAQVGCNVCHVPTLTTAPAGTQLNGGKLVVPDSLGGKTFHPYSDFLLHDIGTGDGIVMSVTEHYGNRVYTSGWPNFSLQAFQATANKMRTAPLWGVRTHTLLMHDGASVTFFDAIARHAGEASDVTKRFQKLSPEDQQAIVEFLKSL